MNTTELIQYVRDQASIATQSTEWDSVKILQLLNQARTEIFEPIIAGCSGYWVHTLTRTLGANNPVVRLPPRTAAFIQADIRRSPGNWCPLQEALESEQQDVERERSNYPSAFLIRGSTMHLIPAAVDNSYELRIKIIVRPSVLYLPQAGGLVTNVDLNTNIITLTSLPNDNVTSVPIASTLNVDIIEPSDNYELSLFHAQATVLDSTHVQIANGYNLTKIQNGDALRAANQSEWPQLPDPFHPSLGAAAAIAPCNQRDLYDRAASIQQTLSGAVIRLADHLKPRVRTQTQERRPIQHSWT